MLDHAYDLCYFWIDLQLEIPTTAATALTSCPGLGRWSAYLPMVGDVSVQSRVGACFNFNIAYGNIKV